MVADPYKRHRWKVHPAIHARRTEIIYTIILIILVLILFSILTFKNTIYKKIEQWKLNYTNLHHEVNQLKILHKDGHE